MGLNRRNLLIAGGLGAAATVFDPLRGLRGAAYAAAARPVYTTLDRTLVRTPHDSGFYTLEPGDGEQHVVRTDLGGTPATVVTVAGPVQPDNSGGGPPNAGFRRPVAAFAQMTDLHIVDDQSPMRVEFLDRYKDTIPPYDGSYPTEGAYRAHETMSTHIVDAMARAIRRIGAGPITSLPFAFTMVTGDMVDNCQYNETRWYIDLLDGNTIRPNSGDPNLDHSVSSDALGLDKFYWHPADRTSEVRFSTLDVFFQAGFPDVPNLVYTARQPFTGTGLGMPWYAAYGNHDTMVQGNIPPNKPWIGKALNDYATGNFKPSALGDPLPVHFGGAGEAFDFVSAIVTPPAGVLVPADPNRRLLTRQQFRDEHFSTTGLPVGHGFGSAPASDACYYEIPAAADDPVRYLVLDSTRTDTEAFGPRGAIDEDQWNWLVGRLKAYSSTWLTPNWREDVDGNWYLVPDEPYVHNHHDVEDKLIVIFAHHTIDTMTQTFDVPLFGGTHYSGEDLKNLLVLYPNVILMVNGHKHQNNIWAHPRDPRTGVPGGFWEVNTASHIDWPIQSRIIEITEGDGNISIYTTMLDIDAPLNFTGDISTPDNLAGLARQVAANDIQSNVDGKRGADNARNTQLVLPSPFNPVVVNPVSDVNTFLGAPYWLPLTTAHSPYPHTWSATGLPPGVSLDAATGVISGTTNQPGVYPVTYTVTDIYGHAASGTFTNLVHLPAPTGSHISSAPDSNTWLLLFATDDADNVVHYLATAGWVRYDGAARAIGAEINADGRTEVFVVTASGTIFHRSRSVTTGDWGRWVQIDGELYSIDATRNTDGRMEIFGTNDLGMVWHRAQAQPNSSGVWSPWEQLDGPYMVKVVAETHADGRIGLFGLDGLGHVFQRAQLVAGGATGWSPWTQIDGTLTTIAVARDTDKIEMFGTDSWNQIWRRGQAAANSQTWTPWIQIEGSLRDITAVRAWDGRVQIAGIHPSGAVYYRIQTTPGVWENTAWAWLSADLAPATVTVPSVTGLTQNQAVTALTTAGVVVWSITTALVNESSDGGRVWRQSIAAGTRVSAGTGVNIVMGVWNGSHL